MESQVHENEDSCVCFRHETASLQQHKMKLSIHRSTYIDHNVSATGVVALAFIWSGLGRSFSLWVDSNEGILRLLLWSHADRTHSMWLASYTALVAMVQIPTSAWSGVETLQNTRIHAIAG